MAFAKYSPKGETHLSQVSRVIRSAVKNDTYISFTNAGKTESVNGIEFLAAKIVAAIQQYPFLKDCLNGDVVLVPIPRSAPLKTKDALWPPLRICQALLAAGLGSEISPLLIRSHAVQKSATAPKGMRATPEDHYDSTAIDNDVPALIEKPITLVDDVVTRGSSFVGMFRRLAEAFPNRTIRCFALIQTLSEGEVDKIILPVQGTITRYPSGRLWRDTGGGAQQSWNF
ncbi:MAG TPA: phosphoribosyltransferase [Verrucomicrobiae bacterium]|nr:phosphoribosyltransferase [Verrucomicrobiae bacterium]